MADMEPIVHFNSTTLVKPSTDPSNGSLPRRIEFTPMDLQRLAINYIQFGLLFNKPTPKQLEEELIGNNVIDHLRDSLSRTLEIFAPLAGRLAITEHQDKARSFYLDCNNGDGALFIDAAAPGVTVAQILETISVPEVVYSLLPMEGVRNFEGVSKPLLAVQVTELVDGLFIGIAMNHTVADGSAFWHFVNTWSEISRSLSSAGEEPSQPAPVMEHDRYLDGIIEHPIGIPDFVYQQIIGDQGRPSNWPPRKVRIFHFTKESIAALKAKANAEIGNNSAASNTSISSLQVILAHFWRSMTRIKLLEAAADTEGETLCRVAMNVRHRLRPPLPDRYFGNAIIVESTSATAGELLGHGLGWAAIQINKMIAQQTDEEIKRKLKAWVERPQAPKLGSQPKSNMVGLVVGGSPWFDVYGNDFGWGKPIAVRGGREKFLDCLIFSHPGAGEDGSVDIHACLNPEILLALENDTESLSSAGGPSHYQELSQHVPVIQNWFLVGIEHPIRIPDFVYQGIIVDHEASNSPPNKVRILHFTKESVAALKAKANAELNGSPASNISISSLQAILAHFWRSITRIKWLEAAADIEEAHFTVVMNARHRLQPPLPDKYFRNAILVGSTTARADELVEHGLGWAALQINKLIARQTDEEIKWNLKAWVEQPQAPKFGQPESNMVGLVVGGSLRFDVYDNDFGWGKPIAVRGGREKLLDCFIFSHPGAGEDGSVDIHACLNPEMLLTLQNDRVGVLRPLPASHPLTPPPPLHVSRRSSGPNRCGRGDGCRRYFYCYWGRGGKSGR
ncbi:hypothetical protein Tsubulata_042962 [Turnera subulata]|uniref:HXXXD-type acyl-transferase family protein n=1 Tax=Turnera subulata TaxID=218843 RepID=A0A9Q0F2F4_9ROSI|nr:hypothetical protein Tsubulata_042962 [Turnera subulata]